MAVETCDKCGQKIRSKRGEGAAYVKDWTHLPPANMKLLCYLIEKYPYAYFEKPALMQEYKATTPDPLSGRLSELVGLELVQMIATGKDKQKTPAAFNTSQELYRLNLAKANAVINAGGRLK